MSNKKTTEQFIEESKGTYGEVYDYSDTIYRGRFKPVSLRCSVHGSFTVATASSHLRKNVGCTLCKRFSKGMEHIKEHYDTSKYTFEDISSHTTTRVKDKQDLFIRVICKDHGLCREGRLRDIAKGTIKNLCNSCLRENTKRKKEERGSTTKADVTTKTLPTEEVKERCLEVFGSDISFDKMVYINSKTKFTLGCNIHDHYFNVILKDIRSGEYGCKFCKKENRKEKTKQDFLQKCLAKYGVKYDYSDMGFINMSTKIKIGCPIHRSI